MAEDDGGGDAAAPPLPRGRRAVGHLLAIGLPAALTAVLVLVPVPLGPAGRTLLYLLALVAATLVGGLGPALVSALLGSQLLNFFFIPPVHTLRIRAADDVVALAVFLLVGGVVAGTLQRAAAAAARAERAGAQARTLAAVADSLLGGEEALPALVGGARRAFGMSSASLLRRQESSRTPARESDPVTWRLLQGAGPAPARTPAEADETAAVTDDVVLTLTGRRLRPADRVVLGGFAAAARGLIERTALTRTAAVAARLQASERLQTALFAAVGHDLRTPLAAATAAVTSLRGEHGDGGGGDVTFSTAERAELLAGAEESLRRLDRLVADLLDLSRLRAGALVVTRERVWLDEIAPRALDELGRSAGGERAALEVSEDLPPVLADPALLVRVLVNLVGNAVRHAPSGVPPVLRARSVDGGQRLELLVVDRGPGIAAEDLPQVFTPFQRLGDTGGGTGLGLGLALSRGLVEAMGGAMRPETTPGGGLTMVVTLLAAPLPPRVADPEEGRSAG